MNIPINGIEVFEPEGNGRVQLEGAFLETFREVLEWACDQLEGKWAWSHEPTIYQGGEHTITLKYREGTDAQLIWKILPTYDKEQISVFAHNANLAVQALVPNRRR